MFDFICEERPSSRRPAKAMDGFVAELRPRICPGLPAHDSPMYEETALKGHHFALEDHDTNQSLEKLLSNKSRQEYRYILTTSIKKLVQTFFTGQDLASIEGSLQVSFHGTTQPIQVKLNESFPVDKRNDFFDIESEIGIKCREQRPPSVETIWDVDQYMYHNQLSPDLLHRDEVSSVGSSPPRTEQTMSEHDKETNLTPINGELPCSMKRNVSPICNAEIACVSSPDNGSGEDSDSSDNQGHASPQIELAHKRGGRDGYVYGKEINSEEASEKDDGMESPLVIDVTNPIGERETILSGLDHTTITRDSYSQSPIHQNHVISSSSDDSDCNLPLTSSDDTDSDTALDLSGDCKIIKESKSVSKENGNEEESPSVLKSFKCQMCIDIFSDMNTLCKHVSRQHQAYMCQHCSRVFTAKNNLKRHIRIHTGLKPYKCTQCSSTFARRDDLKGHLLRHDYNKPYRCSICKKGYTDRVCVKNHMLKEHGSRLMYVCPQCGESFDQEDCFSAHKKTHPELNQYACDICPFIGSNNLMACKHSLVHTRKLFSCKPCNAFFADPFGYTDHIRKHKKNENFTKYVCCFCDMSLPTYEQFIRHEYSHAHCKTHACHICNKQFRSRLALQEHALNHSDYPDSTCDEKQMHDDSTIEDENTDMTAALDGKGLKDTNEEDNSKMEEECHGRLGVQEGALDLTMKKPVRKSLMNKPCVTSDHSLTEGQEKISNFGVPRNGYVSEFSCPSEKECVLSRTEKTLHRTSVTGTENKDMTYNLNAVLNAKIHQKEFRDLPTERPLNQINGQCRFSPYPLPLKAAELASKFYIARGRSPFIHASATKEMNKRIRLPFERKELVIEKDSSGKASVHMVTQNAYQGNVPTSLKEQMDEKENNCQTTSHVNDIDQSQTANIFYGLTGKQYLKDSSISPSSSTDEPSSFFPSVKEEPMDHDDFVATPTRSPVDNARESVPSPTSMLGAKPSSGDSCDICSQSFECFSQLESHSVITHKRYMCEYCKKGFTSRPNRDRHVRYHTGEKPYKCDLCDTAFHRGDDLKYHRTTRHPEATPFVCSRCSATFTWKRDLDRHIRHSKCKF